jgi:hypothetical protein
MNILKYAAAYRCGEKVADSEQEETMDIEADDLPGLSGPAKPLPSER